MILTDTFLPLLTELMKKTYQVNEGWDESHYYDITYKVNLETTKFIRFHLIEHYLQFIDVLHEAGYRMVDEYA